MTGIAGAYRYALLGVLVAAMAHADPGEVWPLRSGDVVLDDAALARIADGGSLTYFDDGVSRFSAGGAYSYTYADNGGTAFGRFRVEGAGRICIDFRNGFGRCDMYVRNGDRLILLTEQGDRFPVKSQTGIAP